MGIIKTKINGNFTMIQNSAIVANISGNAFRMFCYICSKNSDWNINNSDIKKQLNIKDKDTIAKYWRELELAGLIERKAHRSIGGTYTGDFDIMINDFLPRGDFSASVKNSYRKNPPLSNTDYINNTDLINNTLLASENDSKLNSKLNPNKLESKPKSNSSHGSAAYAVIHVAAVNQLTMEQTMIDYVNQNAPSFIYLYCQNKPNTAILKALNKLSVSECQKIEKHVTEYFKLNPNERFRKTAINYILDEEYNNKLIDRRGDGNGNKTDNSIVKC